MESLSGNDCLAIVSWKTGRGGRQQPCSVRWRFNWDYQWWSPGYGYRKVGCIRRNITANMLQKDKINQPSSHTPLRGKLIASWPCAWVVPSVRRASERGLKNTRMYPQGYCRAGPGRSDCCKFQLVLSVCFPLCSHAGSCFLFSVFFTDASSMFIYSSGDFILSNCDINLVKFLRGQGSSVFLQEGTGGEWRLALLSAASLWRRLGF